MIAITRYNNCFLSYLIQLTCHALCELVTEVRKGSSYQTPEKNIKHQLQCHLYSWTVEQNILILQCQDKTTSH